jgi:hypothetical protein
MSVCWPCLILAPSGREDIASDPTSQISGLTPSQQYLGNLKAKILVLQLCSIGHLSLNAN